LVCERDGLLPLNTEASANEFQNETGLIRRFQKSRTEFPMHLDRGTDDFVGDCIELLLGHRRKAMQESCVLCGLCGLFARDLQLESESSACAKVAKLFCVRN